MKQLPSSELELFVINVKFNYQATVEVKAKSKDEAEEFIRNDFQEFISSRLNKPTK